MSPWRPSSLKKQIVRLVTRRGGGAGVHGLKASLTRSLEWKELLTTVTMAT